MNVLVTGGAGFLGKEIVIALLKKNFSVTSLSRKTYKELEDLGVTSLVCDLSSEKDLDDIDLSVFDAIFHVAALAGVWGRREDFFTINTLGTKSLYNAAKLAGVKYFIYTSSPSVVFGAEDIKGADESLAYPKKYYSDYAESKALAEKFLLNQGDDGPLVIALRPHLIWGEGDPHIFPRLVQSAKEGKLKRIGSGTNLVDVIHVRNAADAHILALESLIQNSKLHGRAYFLGQDKPVNLWDFINRVLVLNKTEPIESEISFKLAYRLGFVLESIYRFFKVFNTEPRMTRFIALQMGKSHYFSHEKAKKDLGYIPLISTDEGLREIYQIQES